MLKFIASYAAIVQSHRLTVDEESHFKAELETRDYAQDEMLVTGETNMDGISFTEDTMEVVVNDTESEASQTTWDKVAGGLKQVSVGWNPNHVWGVTNVGKIYHRQGRNDNWKLVGGSLEHVSVNGRDGEFVWGVNRNEDIYFRRGLGGQWQHIGGKLTQVSVAQNGYVWGVNRFDNIYFRRGVGGQWQGVGGKLVYVSVGGRDGEYVWGVNKNDDIYFRQGLGGQWKHIPGKLIMVEVSDRGEVYGVNRNHNIYKRVGGVNGKWEQLPGGLRHVDVGGSRKHTKFIWGTNRVGNIYFRKEKRTEDC